MAIELIIAPEVEQDLAEAAAWYESRRVGLGEEFLDCVDACVSAILRMPEMQTIVHERYRRVLVRRFPCAVFYKYSSHTITVYAIFHASRDPDKWRECLP